MIAGLLPSAGAGPAITAVALSLAAGALPAGFIFWTSSLLARLPELARLPAPGRAAALGVAAAPAIAALFGQQVLAPAQIATAELLTRRVDERCLRRILTASIDATPLAALEQQSVLDRFGDVRAAFDGASPTPGAAVAGGVALIARYAQLLGAIALVAGAAGPLAGLLVGLTALTIRYGQRGSLARFAARWDQLAGARRRVSYLADLGTGLAAAKELRVLGLVPWLRDRHHGDAHAYLAPMWAQRRRIYLRPFLGYSAVALAGGGAALVLLARGAVTGRLGLFGLSVAVQGVLVAVRFGVFFPESDIKTQHGYETYQAMVAATAPAGAGPPQARRPAVPPWPPGAVGPLQSGIRCEHVVFGYGPAGPPVLDGLDLELPAGRCTAIVGLNGAGKTTLIKLLAGLYQPREGRILVDGADLSGLNPGDWRRRLALVFQDYVRYELSAAANIWMGAPGAPRGRPALLAAADRAGARDVLAGLPGGLATPLSARYRGGTDLSGGQWQRIALARAFFAVQAGATVLILDEPTAHLDVRAETELLRQLPGPHPGPDDRAGLAPVRVGAASRRDRRPGARPGHRVRPARPADRARRPVRPAVPRPGRPVRRPRGPGPGTGPVRDLARAAAFLLALSWRTDRRRLLGAAALMLAGYAATPLIGVALKVFTDAALARHPAAGWAAAAAAALLVFELMMAHFAHLAYFELGELAELELNSELIELAGRRADLRQLESPQFADGLALIRADLVRTREALAAVLQLAGVLAQTAITTAILAAVNPLLTVLLLAALPPVLAGRRAHALIDAAREATAEQVRLVNHLLRLATTAGPVAELSVSQAGAEVAALTSRAWAQLTAAEQAAHRRAAVVRGAGQLVFAAAYAGAIVLVAWQALRGQARVGDVILIITLAVQVNAQVSGALGLLAVLQGAGRTARRLGALRAAAAPEHPAARGYATGSEPAPERPAPGRRRPGCSRASGWTTSASPTPAARRRRCGT